jgi:hypothetical protein
MKLETTRALQLEVKAVEYKKNKYIFRKINIYI